jgi:hypothetical protein
MFRSNKSNILFIQSDTPFLVFFLSFKYSHAYALPSPSPFFIALEISTDTPITLNIKNTIFYCVFSNNTLHFCFFHSCYTLSSFEKQKNMFTLSTPYTRIIQSTTSSFFLRIPKHYRLCYRIREKNNNKQRLSMFVRKLLIEIKLVECFVLSHTQTKIDKIDKSTSRWIPTYKQTANIDQKFI